MSLRWIKEHAPSMYSKVITQVPSIYPHVKKYVKSLGFACEKGSENNVLKRFVDTAKKYKAV